MALFWFVNLSNFTGPITSSFTSLDVRLAAGAWTAAVQTDGTIWWTWQCSEVTPETSSFTSQRITSTIKQTTGELSSPSSSHNLPDPPENKWLQPPSLTCRGRSHTSPEVGFLFSLALTVYSPNITWPDPNELHLNDVESNSWVWVLNVLKTFCQ